jgi:3-oxoacyl-[acyl-carrier protein] reductase
VLNYTSDSSTQKATALATSLQDEHGIKAITVQADMGKPTGPAHIISTAKNNFAHPKTHKFQIDILINNAGVADLVALPDITVAHFDSLYHVNVLGPLLLVQAAIPYLPADRSGRIVNVSSVSSSLGGPAQSVYGGTKAALEAMTRTWARELAENATVNAVNPGPVKTDMYDGTSEELKLGMKPMIQITPLMGVREGVDEEQDVKNAEKIGGRLGYDYEIAGVVAMLCGEDAGWCTGSVVCANGGMKFCT